MVAAEKAREPLLAKRENTIRALGGMGVAGIFTFLIYAIAKGALRDPVAALPTLALVVSFLAPLVRGEKERARRKARAEETDDDDERS